MSYCDSGDLFGLSSLDLTDAQLEKIRIDKIMEFVDTDPRADKIISNRIDSWDVIRKHFSNLNYSEADRMPNTIKKYNEFIFSNRVPIDSWHSRNSYIFWKLLNEDNKIKECKHWLRGNLNVFDPANADFGWLYSKHPRLAKSIASKIIGGTIPYNYKKEQEYKSLIPHLPKSEMDKYLDVIYKEGKPYRLYLASNQFTPDKYTDAILRYMSGKSTIPSIPVVLSKKNLTKLPPVTRLKLLESLMLDYGGTLNFVDINTAQDLESLLFVTAVKYNARVQKVVRSFINKYEKKENTNGQ